MPVPRLRLTLGILAGMVLPLILDGCSPLVPVPLTPDETSAIKGGGSAVVLLRFVGQDQKGDRLEPFAVRSGGGRDLGIAIGDFDSGGVPQSRGLRTLNTSAREEGWLTFVLPPGYYYLVYATARSGELEPLPRWRIEVPPGVPVIYAGTFHLSGTTGYRFLEGRHIIDIDQAATIIENETEAATQTARRDLPALPPPVTRLAVRHTGPALLVAAPPPNEVKLYEMSEVASLKYTPIRTLESSLCRRLLWDPDPTREDALAQIKVKASSFGANGILDVQCTSHGFSLSRNCYSSIMCAGTAIKVDAGAGTNTNN